VRRNNITQSDYIQTSTKNVLNDSRFVSAYLDESTDSTDISQQLIFVRIVNDKFKITEELLLQEKLHGHMSGEDITQVLVLH